ncbi:MAG: bifunctional metallophosphatase/5'-nucleotidase [Bdellovibrio sp. 28-41-41]|nr:MAG: bifunctional metallophosphatase/5'-nucleotidase [Bdellovibrio sp. 28-41-41]
MKRLLGISNFLFFLFFPLFGSAKNSQPITILYIADSHAQIEEHAELFWSEDGKKEEMARAGGFARLAYVVKQIKAKNPNGVLFLDAGDTIQGSGPAVMSQGEALVPLLNKMEIDLAIPGNWEVVYGVEALLKVRANLKYPMIAANIFDGKTGKRVFEPYLIRQIKGIKIAIIGFTDPDVPTRQPPTYSKGFIYKGAEIIQPIVDEIRSQKKADVVILLSHIGLPKAVDLSSTLTGIDVHLSGDTHERIYTPVEKNHWVVEPGSFGSFLGRLDLTMKNKKVVDKKWELIELRADRYKEDKKIKALVEKTLLPYKEMLSKIVGHADDNLFRYEVNQTSLDMVLADAIRDAAQVEIGLSNGFRFAAPIVPGPIYEKDLWSFYPVNNRLRTGKVSGAQLKEFWEKEIENVYSADAKKLFGGWLPRPSGMTIKFKVNAPAGQRIQEIKIGDKLLELDRLYTMAACERDGDPDDRLCRIPKVKEPKSMDVDAHEAVRRYLKKHKAIKAPNEIRVIAVDLPAHVRSQFYRK